MSVCRMTAVGDWHEAPAGIHVLDKAMSGRDVSYTSRWQLARLMSTQLWTDSQNNSIFHQKGYNVFNVISQDAAYDFLLVFIYLLREIVLKVQNKKKVKKVKYNRPTQYNTKHITSQNTKYNTEPNKNRLNTILLSYYSIVTCLYLVQFSSC